MPLTPEDIDRLIAGNAHEDIIRHSLSNYFEDLNEPVAVAIGIAPPTIVSDGERNYYKRLGHSDERIDEHFNANRFNKRDFDPTHVDDLVNILREKGIDAVSFLDKQAADPSKFVVNANGVQCPFMEPEDALKATVIIETAARDHNFHLIGHATPQSVQNMLYSADKKPERKRNESQNTVDNIIDIKASHPQKEKFEALEEKYGAYKDFINKKINDAYTGSQSVDFDVLDVKNVYEDGGEFLFRGGSLGANPYAVISQFNSRKVAHSSPAPSICSSFSGKGHSFSTRGGAVYETTESGLEYGFIYKLRSMGDKQQYYCNVGLETATNPKNIQNGIALRGIPNPWNGFNGEIYETPVLPHHNKLEAIYVHVGKSNENRLFEIPLDENGNIRDQEWRDFMEMHEPTDDKVLGFLAQRQDAQKKEQNQNPKHSYKFELKNDLQKDSQEYLKTLSTKEFVQSFVHKSDVRSLENGLLEIDTSLNLHGLKLSYLPDMANLKINGNLDISTVKEIKAANLPETTNGIICFNGKITETSEISAEKFTKIIGADNINGWYDTSDNIHCILDTDGIPQGWEKLKFIKLPNGINMEYASFDQIPETRHGTGLSGIKIKDQSSIENMKVEDFLHKLNGNVGTRRFPPVLPEEEFTPVERNSDLFLDLSYTNIEKFPKDFNQYTLKTIRMNPETKITSLDNFPVTSEGVYSLNFDGDLKNETMLSFLNKVKGTEWVQKNTSVAQDGHLIVHGDLNFKTERYDSRDNHKMSVKSLPKDFDTIEIKGKIKPENIAYFANLHRELKTHLNDDILIFPTSHQKDFALKELKCTSLDFTGNGNITEKLPQSLQRLCFSDNQTLSALPPLPEKCRSITFCNTTMQGKANLPDNIKTFTANKAIFEEFPAFAQDMEYFSLRDTEFKQGSNINFGNCAELQLQNIKIPDGAVLDFSGCRGLELSGVDLSKCQVIMPKQAKFISLAKVKFPDGYKLDLSNCEAGNVHDSLNCKEIKLPQKSCELKAYIPDNVKEVNTSYLASAISIEHLPEDVKIIDTPDERGKKISLKQLQHRGVPDKQISFLRKERIKTKLVAPFKKLTNVFSKEKNDDVVQIPSAPTATAQEKIAQLRGVENSAPLTVVEAGEKVVEKTAVHAEAAKTSDGIVSTLAKADNAFNQVIDKTIDKGSELLNNNVVGRAYEKAAEKVADTKVVKAVEKSTAKAVEKAAKTTVGKAVTKTVAKAAGSAIGKSVIKKIPLVSAAAGCYFAWDRIKDGDWKGACGEVASGVAGCLPGLGTGISAAIDVGLAAKDIKTAIDESKQPVTEAAANTGEEKTVSIEQTEGDKKKMRDIILQKQGRITPEARTQPQQVSLQNNNYAMQQKMPLQSRG